MQGHTDTTARHTRKVQEFPADPAIRLAVQKRIAEVYVEQCAALGIEVSFDEVMKRLAADRAAPRTTA